MTLTRRSLLTGIGAAPLLRAAARRPNVIMFMTDDHGAWASGAYGCAEIHTPNIDKLAAGGARFTRAFAATPVCSPSRITWLTGKMPSQHGVQDWLIPYDSFGSNSRAWLDGHVTYSELLAKQGYTLGMCGKWHMGQDQQAQRGFSFWHTVPGGGGTYRDPEFVTNGSQRKLTGYKTDLVADGALEFLDTVKDKPFYLLMPFYAPHTPFDYQPEQYRTPYANAEFSCFPNDDTHPAQNPGLARHHRNRDSMRAYSALIGGVDHNVGRIVRRIEEMGVRENTIIIFTADQGWNAGHHGMWGKGNGTVPFNMYEESIRVPLIWNHPGKIRAGEALAPMVSSYDYLPTLLDYLGLPPHKDARLAGASYAPFLRGRRPRWRNRLYFEYAYTRGIRTENLKYIERTREWHNEFYDLEADPGEKKNAVTDAAYKKTVAGLRKELTAFFDRAGAPPLENWLQTAQQRLTQYKRP
ncbi:MAG: sulfatase-like hydrolase/transferase [Bryobacteraceae bacterium]